jgi:carotenoid cleavage dioxygenase-like enzyme
LLPRKGSAADIVWIDIPLGYAFHPLNAYDAPDGTVVIDICNYDCMFNKDTLGPFGDGGLARLERWVLNPQLRSCSVTVIDASSNEFPRHNIAYAGQAYKFGYCASPSQDPGAGWPTLKHNLETGAREVFDHGPGRAGGEPVFVARAGSSGEDEGWLITLVHDLGSGTAELVVIDAEDFARGYVARVLLPQRVPFGFHGNWVSDKQVKPKEA